MHVALCCNCRNLGLELQVLLMDEMPEGAESPRLPLQALLMQSLPMGFPSLGMPQRTKGDADFYTLGQAWFTRVDTASVHGGTELEPNIMMVE
jgi:hypothetical protein